MRFGKLFADKPESVAAPTKTTDLRVLLDTGFLVALYDRHDAAHLAAVQWLRQFQGRFLTVVPVVTEACFFLATEDKSVLLERIAEGWIELAPLDAQACRRVAVILRKYSQLKPDLADACLVWLAETSGIHKIVTVDERDFVTYRIGGRRKFDLLPWCMTHM
jgi:predicted nucleic acid-binding protein